MSRSEAERAAVRRPRWTILAALALVSVALIGRFGYPSLAASSSPSPASSSPSSSPAAPPSAAETFAHQPPVGLKDDDQGAAGVADGVVPDGVTVFDDAYPAVANLDPSLLRALRQAATDAAGDKVTFYVDSGWRSPKYQEQLLREAIAKYGSAKEAARWVATSDTSPHVSGDAVDIGPSDATAWLSEHGATYGLCQIYRNEPWHYELRPDAVDHGCPAMFADPTQDPRMQK